MPSSGARGRLAGIAPSGGYRHLQPANAVHPARHCFSITSGGALVEAAPLAVHGGRLRLRYYGKSAPKRLGFRGARGAALWSLLKAGTFVYSQTPLAGVQCSFQHKAAAGPPSPPSGGLSSSKLRVACRPASRPHFPAFLAGSGRSFHFQRSWRGGSRVPGVGSSDTVDHR